MLRHLLITVMLSAMCQQVIAMDEDTSDGTVSSVSDRVRALDSDQDGQLSADEIRAFLLHKHGEHYAKSTLYKLGASSCNSPFSRAMY